MSFWLILVLLITVAALISAAVLFGMTWSDMRQMRQQ